VGYRGSTSSTRRAAMARSCAESKSHGICTLARSYLCQRVYTLGVLIPSVGAGGSGTLHLIPWFRL
jgi:hypothetical protein